MTELDTCHRARAGTGKRGVFALVTGPPFAQLQSLYWPTPPDSGAAVAGAAAPSAKVTTDVRSMLARCRSSTSVQVRERVQ